MWIRPVTELVNIVYKVSQRIILKSNLTCTQLTRNKLRLKTIWVVISSLEATELCRHCVKETKNAIENFAEHRGIFFRKVSCAVSSEIFQTERNEGFIKDIWHKTYAI